MRVMQIPPFPRKGEILDLENFLRTRLSQTVVMWPDQAMPLAGYMGWPNDPAARGSAVEILRQWADGSKVVPPGLGRIQHEWLRVADILSLHYDLVQGEHQKRRGGASIGKAITLAAANTKSWGTAASSFWKNWSTYKDVAHLVTAATMICYESRSAFTRKPFGPSGLAWNQLIPFQMAMFMPDLVIAVALNLEDLGLSVVPHVLAEPIFGRETLWRIPPDINVVPVPPPVRKIRAQDVMVLNKRRAGNRGKRKGGNARHGVVSCPTR
jgi:hypothetical protein